MWFFQEYLAKTNFPQYSWFLKNPRGNVRKEFCFQCIYSNLPKNEGCWYNYSNMTVTISITVIFQVRKFKKCQLIPGYKAPHFEQNMIFPSKSTTITINSVLMPVNRCNFRKIWSKHLKKSSNMNHLPTFGHKNLSLIFKTVTANYSLMLAVWYNFKKSNQKIKNRKKISTLLILERSWPIHPILGQERIFSKIWAPSL